MTLVSDIRNAPEYPYKGVNDSEGEQARISWADRIAEQMWPGCESGEYQCLGYADVYEYNLGEYQVGEVIYDHRTGSARCVTFEQDVE